MPTRETLDDWAPELLHAAHSAAQGDVYLLRRGGRELILKDCARRWGPFRWLWGAAVLRRECRVLKRLEGTPGVPRFCGWLDRHGLLMERLDAIKLTSKRRRRPPPEYFDRLVAAIERMHERGVAHGDLRRGNILIDDADRPFLIDFATAIDRGGFCGRLLFRHVARVDALKALRLKKYYLGAAALTAAELACVNAPPWTLRVAHFFKHGIYRHIKQKRWQARWRRLKKSLRGKSRSE